LFPESTNSPDIGGDGCAMAYLAGGRMTDMEFIQFEPSAAVWPPELVGKSIITTMFYEGAVLRGGDGKRFADEKVSKDVLAKAISRELLRGNATPHGGVWFDATAVPEALWNGIYKPYRSRYLAHGIDMAREPVEIAPAAHTTCGGVLIDENCRTGIPGLLACGEVTGGLHGANRLGGNAGLETMVFGRIAGQTACAEWGEAETEEHVCPNHPADVDVQAMRATLAAVLRRSLGVIRTEEGLRRGIAQTDGLLNGLGEYENSFEKYRLYNDLLTARMALLSALARRGSVGCHFREDSADEAANRVILENRAGQMTVLREEI
jgi:aspartate oxidase